MNDCRRALEALPEYVLGRAVTDRDRIAGHLSRCDACDAARREIEAVYALLSEEPEPHPLPSAEVNARFALQNAFGEGPLRVEERNRRREAADLLVCAAVSLAFTGVATALAFAWRGWGPLASWAPRFPTLRGPEGLASLMPTLPLSPSPAWSDALLSVERLLGPVSAWHLVAVFVAVGGLIALMPAVLLHAPQGQRHSRREA